MEKEKKNSLRGNIWVKFVLMLLAVTFGSAAILCLLATILFGSDTDLQGTRMQIESMLDERLLETYGAVFLDSLDFLENKETVEGLDFLENKETVEGLDFSEDEETAEGLDFLDGGNIRYTLVLRGREGGGEPYTEKCLYSNDERVTENNCMVSLTSNGCYGGNAASFLNALAGCRRSWFAEDTLSQYCVYLSVGELVGNERVPVSGGTPVLKGGVSDYTYDAARLAGLICWFRHTSGWWLLAFGILFLICFGILLNAAGARDGEEQIRMRWIDRVPLELCLCAAGFLEAVALGGALVAINDGLGYGSISTSLVLSFALLCLAFGVFVALLLCMSLAVRAKAKKLWRYTLLCYLLTPVYNLCQEARKNMPLFVKGLLLLIAVTLLELLLVALCDGDEEVLLALFFLYKLVEIPVVLHVLMQMNRLKKGGMRIAAGNYGEPIDTRYMLWEFKRHGENINRVGDGISLAVEERMKSERFRTELITNVSHDIKTPLTSIINYVDLMKKRGVEDETMQEYMAVLDRQSARLKKLIEDLMEASKASTGNLPVNYEDCDTAVMLSQVVGEFEDRAAESGLELIVTCPDEPAHIRADGRHLWRIFDNLMSNVCKYAMPGTRVYIDLERFRGMVIVTFRNISRSQLNVSSEELMERFVRGDSSRNTEGSGLGLSIAQSLTALMKGNMAIQIDGDLFKAIVSFEEISV